MRLAAPLVALALLAGCGGDDDAEPAAKPVDTVVNDSLTNPGTPTEAEAKAWPEQWCKAELGMTRAQLVELMGQPTEEYDAKVAQPQSTWGTSGFDYTAFYDSAGKASILQVNEQPGAAPCARDRRSDGVS